MESDSATTPPDLKCARCDSSLVGLTSNQPCPECSFPIAKSIAAQRSGPPETPLPLVLRVAQTGYFTLVGALFMMPFWLPTIAKYLDMTTLPIERSEFVDQYQWLFLRVLVVGLVLAVVHLSRRDFSRAGIVFVLSMLLGILMPAFSST